MPTQSIGISRSYKALSHLDLLPSAVSAQRSTAAMLRLRRRGNDEASFLIRPVGCERFLLPLGSDHHELTFDASELAAALPHVIYHLESADVDLVRSAIPTHFATTLASQHVKAVLTGEGADESFAGCSYSPRLRALAAAIS